MPIESWELQIRSYVCPLSGGWITAVASVLHPKSQIPHRPRDGTRRWFLIRLGGLSIMSGVLRMDHGGLSVSVHSAEELHAMTRLGLW